MINRKFLGAIFDIFFLVFGVSARVLLLGIVQDTPLQNHAYHVPVGRWEEWLTHGASPTISAPQRITEEGFSHNVTFTSADTLFDVASSSSAAPKCWMRYADHQPICFMERKLPAMYQAPELITLKSQLGHDVYTAFFAAAQTDESTGPLPTLLFLYGGPHGQIVQDAFNKHRFTLLQYIARCGFNVVAADCRGTANRGLAFEAPMKHAMGTFEVNEYVEVMQQLAKDPRLRIDLGRVAVHGWSYGGYLSLMCLAQRPDIFKAAIAGAPVTMWEGYDTGYTERYMALPSTHTSYYAQSSVVARVHDFPDEPNRLLILHGLNDENVHFQHTATLIQHLIEAGKPYNLQVSVVRVPWADDL
eukprot:m.182234 g.182234  ORF g.182234 m.182234 type:complete len:359 (+) comp16639_c6_seq9:1753-2829(+)